ncbi:hypothetical protein C8J56DRAFT_930404 [Mycena floridula]|nr:hypothetical protein C8J56DRAFT_930404 [Mycena floridula]
MSRVGRPPPTLEASQQSHIDDLVQRNRTLEHNLEVNTRKFKEQLILAKKKGLEDVKHTSEQWRQTCDILSASHRIWEMDMIVELEKEKMNVLTEQDALRVEKVARLHRQCNLTMFQARESDLETRIEDLEEENQDLKANSTEVALQTKELITTFVMENRSLTAQILALETELGVLRESSVQRQASNESTASKLERATLQLEGAQTRNDELNRLNGELTRTNQELQRQVTKWQSLETKEGAEVDSMRKARVELEVQVKVLEGQLEKEASKAKSNSKKLKDSISEWQKHAEEQQEEIDDLKIQLANAIDQLQHEVSTKAGSPEPPPVEPQDLSDPEPGPSKPASKAVRSRTKPAKATVVDDSEIEEVLPSKTKRKGKGKAVESESEQPPKRRAKRAAPEESEVEEVVEKPKSKGGKAKASPARKQRESTLEISDVEVAAKSTKPPSKRPRNGANTRAASVQPSVIDDSADEAGEQPKKKKRKINIFPTVQPTTNFNFGSQGAGGLNIPTALSPVKESEVPARSTSFLSTASSMLMGGFTRRK